MKHLHAEMPAVKATHRTIGGVRVELLESPGIGTPLFAFHGNSGQAKGFWPLLTGELGRHHRIVAVSFPGHGNSDPARNPGADYTIAALGQFATEVVRSYGVSSYWLLGQSLGGHALLEALDAFSDASGLLLVSSPPISADTLAEAFKPDPTEGCLFKGELSDDDVRQMASCFLHRQDSAAIALLMDGMRRTEPRFRTALGASLVAGRIRDERVAMRGARMPIAFLRGVEDRFLRAEYYDTLPSSRIWAGQVIAFDECGHALHLEAETQLELLVGEFLADTAA